MRLWQTPIRTFSDGGEGLKAVPSSDDNRQNTDLQALEQQQDKLKTAAAAAAAAAVWKSIYDSKL